jgi:hypothetical protein
MIRRSLYDERVRDLALAALLIALCALAVLLWGPQ